jgi:hypothetical protein
VTIHVPLASAKAGVATSKSRAGYAAMNSARLIFAGWVAQFARFSAEISGAARLDLVMQHQAIGAIVALLFPVAKIGGFGSRLIPAAGASIDIC